jgi:hypothetical protein
MRQTPDSKAWSIEVLLEETEDETQATAFLDSRGERVTGWGRARRNPTDPAVPQIGEELATARALADLAHKLLEAAIAEIEGFEGHKVSVHL